MAITSKPSIESVVRDYSETAIADALTELVKAQAQKIAKDIMKHYKIEFVMTDRPDGTMAVATVARFKK